MRGWFRRSPALWILPAASLALLMATVLDSGAHWVGWWQRTAVVVHVATAIVLGTLVAALSAGQVASVRARGTALELSSPRSGVVVLCRLALPTFAVAAACFLVLQGAAYARTALVSDGTPVLSLAVLTLGLLAVASSFGALVGAWLPTVAAALVAPVVLLVAMALPVYVAGGEEGFGRLLPVIQQPGWDPALVAANGRLLLAAGWLFAAAAVMIVLAARGRYWPAPGLRVVLLVTCVGALAATLTLSVRVGDALAFVDLREPSDGYTCRSVGSTQVCVWNDQVDLLPRYEEASRSLQSASAITGVQPGILVEAGLEAYIPGSWAVTTLERRPTTQAILEQQVSRFISYPPMGCERFGEPALAGALWDQVLLPILADAIGVELPSYYTTADPALIDRIQDLPEETRLGYIASAQAAFQACDPVPPLP